MSFSYLKKLPTPAEIREQYPLSERGKEIKPMLWISLAVIVVFGSLTLWLQNELFIKWKPTILYWIFGAILLYGRATNRNFIQSLLGGQIVMEKRGWHIMQWSWIGFFFVTGIVNLLVAYTCSTDTWVNFKLFGLMGMTSLCLAKYMVEGQNSSDTKA